MGRGDFCVLCVKGLSSGLESVLLCLKSQKEFLPHSVCSHLKVSGWCCGDG